MPARDGRIRSDEGLGLETSAFELFTVANLQFQLGQYYQKTEQFIITFITTITKNLSFVHKKTLVCYVLPFRIQDILVSGVNNK